METTDTRDLDLACLLYTELMGRMYGMTRRTLRTDSKEYWYIKNVICGPWVEESFPPTKPLSEIKKRIRRKSKLCFTFLST